MRPLKRCSAQLNRGRVMVDKACLVALAMLSVAGHAESGAEGCAAFQYAAESVMEIRQAGMPPVFLYDRAEGAGIDMSPVFRRMVTDAYDTPKYDTEPEWNQAIREFGHRWYALCRESLAK